MGHFSVFRGSTSQRPGETTKRMDRLAPNLVHVCGFDSYGYGHSPAVQGEFW